MPYHQQKSPMKQAVYEICHVGPLYQGDDGNTYQEVKLDGGKGEFEATLRVYEQELSVAEVSQKKTFALKFSKADSGEWTAFGWVYRPRQQGFPQKGRLAGKVDDPQTVERIVRGNALNAVLSALSLSDLESGTIQMLLDAATCYIKTGVWKLIDATL